MSAPSVVATGRGGFAVSTPAAPAGPRHQRPEAPTRRFRRMRKACLIAVWVSAAAAGWVWARDGGLDALRSDRPAFAVAAVGRLTGLLAADLTLVQMLLMARIPALELGFGHRQLVRLHRWIGAAALALLMVHVAAIVAADGMRNGDTYLSAGLRVATAGWSMALAVLAAAMLLAGALAARRGLRRGAHHEASALVGLNAYVGVAFAVPHQLVAGSAFHTSTLATVYWVGLYALTLLAVAVYRVLVPLHRALSFQLAVDRLVAEGPQAVSIHLRGKDLDGLGARAGNLFSWRFMARGSWASPALYSLSAAHGVTGLRITVPTTDVVGRRLASLRPGTWVLAEGPMGHLTQDVRSRRRLAFFAAGSSIGPIRALVEELDYQPGDATLIYRVHPGEEVLFAGELDDLMHVRGLDMVVLAGESGDRRSWLPRSWAHVEQSQAVLRLVPDVAVRDVYIAGPEGWVTCVASAVAAAGVPARQVHHESPTR